MNTLALCIPAYNAAAYLPRLLQSAKKQLIPFSEILVYDDCSLDDTAAIAQEYGATVIKGGKNQGCAYGKNQLADITTCNWIHFHDADDDLMPHFTTLAHKWINKSDCEDIVLFNYEYRDNKTNELIAVKKFDGNALKENSLAYAILTQINPFCGIYKKQRFINAGGYDTDPSVLYNEDSAFHIKMAIAGLTFAVEEEISIVNYRINLSMSSANELKCLAAQYHVMEKTAYETHLQYAREIAIKSWDLAGRFAAKNDWDYVKKALSLCGNLGHYHPPSGTQLFKLLTYVNAYMAVWLRETLIKLLKPQSRS